jgi:DNA-binding CsgD family transcriptional regulator
MGTERKNSGAVGGDDPLTRRELDVLALVAAGKRSSEVGRQLGVSEATVKRHLYNLYQKLGVTNRVGATMWYVEHHGQSRKTTPKATTRRR